MNANKGTKFMNELKELYPASPKATQNDAKRETRRKYPWNEMEIGQSFTVNHNEVSKKTLIPFTYRMSKKLNKTFRLIDHPENKVYEITRYADPVSATTNALADLGTGNVAEQFVVAGAAVRPLTLIEALNKEKENG